MVEISVSDDDKFLVFKAEGNQFSEIIDSFKYAGLRYDPKHKQWKGKIGLYHYYKDYFAEYGISEDEYIKKFIQNWSASISELKRIEKRVEFRKFVPELLKKEPR